MLKLVIADDQGKIIHVPLGRELYTIGRQDGNNIRLTERNVSRQHARLLQKGDGYELEDLDSYNGVAVNGQRLVGSAVVGAEDQIEIGDYVLTVKSQTEQVDAEAEGAASADAHPSERPSPARLVMVSAPAPGAEFSIAGDEVKIGRLEDLDLCISHRSISREHAAIRHTEGTFEIEDLGSANGVQVNSDRVVKATLSPGDLVDLGQVRFRFVGVGESYQFDPSEFQSGAEGFGGGRLNMTTVASIVGVAVVLGAALAWVTGGEDDAQAEADVVMSPEARLASVGDPSPPAVPEPPAVPAEEPGDEAPGTEAEQPELQVAELEPGEALRVCRAALEDVAPGQEKPAAALDAAISGLAAAPDDAELANCKGAAEARIADEAQFERGRAALAEGDVQGAFEAFQSLVVDGSARDRAEVVQALEGVARTRLAEAEQALPGEIEEARQLIAEVLALPDLPGPLLRQARALGRQADFAEAQNSRKAAAASRRASVAQRRAAAKRSAAAKRATSVKRGAAAKRSTNQRPARRDSQASAAVKPADAARACLAKGDQRCVVRALEGKARTLQEMALLIETYRALGDTRKAVRAMERFVRRFPGAKQSPQYRRFIARNGG